ncbi:MAG: hypothetical protein DMG24_02050, partial [Acidobacteria bacterium]
ERSELKLWAAEGLNDVWKAQDVPEKGLQTALALLAAGMLVGMELQKAAAEVSVLEDLYTNQNAPGSTEA